MAVTEEKLKDAVSKIESVSNAVHAHIGAQAVVNDRLSKDVDKNTEDIVSLRLDAEKKNGTLELVRSDLGRIISIVSDGPNKVLAWFNALTPWAFVILGLVYFYVKQNGATP